MIFPAVALFVVFLGYGVVVPLLPQLAGRGADDAKMVSLVYATYSACRIGSQAPGGMWVDRVGGARVLAIALVVYTISLGGFLVGSDLRWFLFVRAIEGVATGLAYPAIFALVLSHTDSRSGGARLGMVTGIGSSGMVFGPVLGASLATRGARVPIGVALGASVAVTIVSLVIALRGRAPEGRLDEEKPMRERLGELAQMARSPLFWALTLPVGFNKLTFSSLQGILPLYGARGLGLTTTRIALLFVLIGVCFGVAQPVGGALADRFAPRAVSIAFMPPMLLALLGMSMTRAFATFTIAFATYIFCSSLIFAATMKHTAAAFGTNDTYGGVSGIFATVTDLMTIVGPLLFLNIYGVADGAVFEWMAGVGVAFMGAFVLFGRDRGARNRLTIRP